MSTDFDVPDVPLTLTRILCRSVIAQIIVGQITGTISVTASGKFLPIQLIYQGKTDWCHPKFNFPKEFCVTHTENHWSNERKAIEYVMQIREKFGFCVTKEWVLVADVFKAHWADAVKIIISDSAWIDGTSPQKHDIILAAF